MTREEAINNVMAKIVDIDRPVGNTYIIDRKSLHVCMQDYEIIRIAWDKIGQVIANKDYLIPELKFDEIDEIYRTYSSERPK